MLSKIFNRKPLWLFGAETAESKLQREYGFLSLVLFGIGGTVGSGIFVISGQIAATMAGPATCISWLIAGVCSAITALAYCELAALLLSPGSTYAFSYYGLGEAFAMISAWLVSLEYGFSGAAVARSWGEKIGYWLDVNDFMDCPPDNCWIHAVGGSPFNPAATVISVGTTFLLARGVRLEKNLINILVTIKVLLVVFVIVVGAAYSKSDNLTPFVPQTNELHNGSSSNDFQGGISGILVGATTAFFGFVGFDEVACMTGEAKRPKRDVPAAILTTIVTICILYVAASLVLTGMVPYDKIDQSEGFGSAFMASGAKWAMQITLAGEILVVLPTIVLVSYAPQSRVMLAAALDGQLHPIFGRVNAKGTVVYSVWVSGAVFALIAAFVPFKNLNDLISGGILLSFILTNMSLLLSRSEQKGKPQLFIMVLAMGILCLLINKGDMHSTVSIVFAAIMGVIILFSFGHMWYTCSFSTQIDTFKVPAVPFVPAIAIFICWFLMTQLPWLGLIEIVGLVFIAIIAYFAYGFRHTLNFEKEAALRFPPSNSNPVKVEVK
mmetsp:Transcript_39309/g.63825  ORF Transcript_39309/g.63825 Transcript_39309/m.63825 type:complete len:552 (+) Transcript_39309:181-1836(+)